MTLTLLRPLAPADPAGVTPPPSPAPTSWRPSPRPVATPARRAVLRLVPAGQLTAVAARRFVVQELERWHVAARTTADAAVLTSEVVADAAAGLSPTSELTLDVRIDPAGQVHVQVVRAVAATLGERLAGRPAAADASALPGTPRRATVALDRLATAWGVQHDDTLLRTWFTLGPRVPGVPDALRSAG